MSISPGIELLAEEHGVGEPAKKGDHVVYNVRIFLNRGEEVLLNEEQARHGLPGEMLRREGDRIFVDHRVLLGQRRAIPGIERSLVGMRPGGRREIRVAPHLAYRARGIPGLIPANAVLVIHIWLRAVQESV